MGLWVECGGSGLVFIVVLLLVGCQIVYGSGALQGIEASG